MIQIPEFLTEEYVKKHRRGRKRHFHTALSWTDSMDITESEFNNYLMDLEYQVQRDDTKSWERTSKGEEHSRKIFRKIYWDLDAFFDVLKKRGIVTRTYFYCEKCGTYNRILDEERHSIQCSCHVCGEIMENLN